MKNVLFLIFILTGCIKSNIAGDTFKSNNETFSQKQYPIHTPIYNIPYVTMYVTENENYPDEKMRHKMAGYAYNTYNNYSNYIQNMKDTMTTVTEKVQGKAFDEYGNVKYKYNLKTNQYDVDEDSIQAQFPVPNLQQSHQISSKLLNSTTAIPYKNAIEILNMKQHGYTPNAAYIDNLLIKRKVTDVTHESVENYQITDKQNIYKLAGIDISNVIKAMRNEKD